jgi:hypothetical protein
VRSAANCSRRPRSRVPGLIAGGADAGGVPEHVEVAGLAGDASASGAVVRAVVEVVLPDARDRAFAGSQ